MKILGIIPARYGSTRFPAKALALLGKKTIVQRVYEQALKAKSLDKVIIATDHSKIYDHVIGFGGEVTMTSQDHRSGTDRCHEAFSKEKDHFDYIINIQGDEPFIDPKQIDLLARCFDNSVQLATLIKRISDAKILFDPNVVKVITNTNSEAIYFSRETIPHLRGVDKAKWLEKHSYYKHIGIYGYRADILKSITKLSASSLEKAESLEQLRWIENGYKIRVAETQIEAIGIDTPEDLEKAKELI
ncbi:3-deoxy-manno-octulosonate cytidylyltransferase [Fulvivirgaceae bacterium BMA10]|uniref:3-deoxy-manno-octulosonate cytidylyltransferase n=1 Tax=Splendidivirga corallicola TaxID=3051826 RepID=A0ABT8KNX0_9BACT|nr:3-deoxy-manno-octulosonate cytidylyltransferase [Fulvivirgaceae bacterium BMA10]